MNCNQCGHEIHNPSKVQLDGFKRRGRAYCSKDCSNAYRATISSLVMARTNKQHASARMKTNNPMHRGDAKERMTATIKAIGHKPKSRGGNGKITASQKLLADALITYSPIMELSIPTTAKRGNADGYSTHYKIDIALPYDMIAIEVDGNSHSGKQKERDERKTRFLNSLGWDVMRVSNKTPPPSCVAAVQMIIAERK